ncbi:MAG: tetratricopeptide repeat protein [Roseiarcus sp.]|jgi:tetratricopeptide (TPR) repeat protein
MFRHLGAASILLAVACASPVLAEGQSGGADCGGLNDPETFVVAVPDGAITDCTRIIQGAGPPRERAIASINRAIAHVERANFGKSDNEAADRDAAAADFDAAVRLDPNFAFAYYARGAGSFVNLRGGRVADFDEAIRLDPTFALAYLGRAKAWYAKGDYQRAEADFSAAIRLDPTLGRAYLGRGAERRLTGDDDGAIADLSEALRLTADDRNTYVRAAEARGAIFFVRGEPDRAVADFNDALRLDPKDAYALQQRGVVQLMRGSLDLARADLQQATDLAPGNAEAALWREIADRRAQVKGRLAEAAETLNMRHWPASAIHAFLGEPTSPTMQEEAAADDFDSPIIRQLQTCQASVFTGELALLKGAKAEAAEAFTSADKSCLKGAPERGVAAAELKSLGAKP